MRSFVAVRRLPTTGMEVQFIKESVVRDHQKKYIWRPVVGQLLPVLAEPGNRHDKRAIAVYHDGEIVGHTPRELSKIFWFFLKHNGKIVCEITEWRKHGKGLEVPCVYKLNGPRAVVERARELLL